MKIILYAAIVICSIFMTSAPVHAYNDGWAGEQRWTEEAEQRRKQEQQQQQQQPTMKYTSSCVVNGESVVVTANGAVLSRANGYMQVGTMVPGAQYSDCLFIMTGNRTGNRYCVNQNGNVFPEWHNGASQPIGICRNGDVE